MDSTHENNRHKTIRESINENETQITKDDKTSAGISHDIDYVLEKIVGSGGWGQWIVMLACYPIGLCSGYPLLLHMFAAFEPSHRCFIPQCDNYNSTTQFDAQWVADILPTSSKSNEIFNAETIVDPCKMYSVIKPSGRCNAISFNLSSTIQCDSFIYDNSVFQETLTSKFDLICEDDHKHRFLGTLMMLGLLFGSLVGGQLGDRIGRKRTMLLAVTIIIPTTMFGGFSPNYPAYAILRFVSCSCLPLIWVCRGNLILELFGTEHRKWVIFVLDFTSALSQIVVVLIIYLERHWKYMHIWAGVACAVSLPCFLLVPESIRWLVFNGRRREAEIILFRIAKRNGKKLNSGQQQEIQRILERVEIDAKETHENLNPLHMLKDEKWKNTFILVLSWVSVCLGVYTLTFNSTKLSGNIFINQTLAATCDLPGTFVLLLTLKYFRRKTNFFYTQFGLGIACLALAFIPKERYIAVLIVYLCGKCLGEMAFVLCWMITSEMYPTNLRSQAVGTCSTVARIFGSVAPFMAKLSFYWRPLPMLILGFPSVMAAFLVYFLPETKYSNLPSTMKECRKQDKSLYNK